MSAGCKGPDRTGNAPAGGGRFVLSSGLLGGSYAVGADEKLGLRLAPEPALYHAGLVERSGWLGCLRSAQLSVPAGGEVRLGLAWGRTLLRLVILQPGDRRIPPDL